MRVWFFGSGAVAVPTLRALAQSHALEMVVTQPDRPQGRGRRQAPTAVKQAARQLTAPILDPPSVKDQALCESLRHSSPDLLVVMAYGGILPTPLLTMPRAGAFNVHPSLLPRYRGAAPIPWAIANGDSETGITVIQMDAQVDHGPIVWQERVPMLAVDTTATLTERIGRLAPAVLLKAMVALESGGVAQIAQDEDRATVAPPLTKADGWMDWTLAAEVIARRVRAFFPWPGSMTSWHGHAIKLLTVVAHDATPCTPGVPPGTVRQVTSEAIIIQTGRGTVAVQRLQLAGGRPMPAGEFLLGHPMRAGDPLGSVSPSAENR